MFTDIVKVQVEAGKGGNGVVSFHRTRGNAKGGPDGGDGGDGGSVIVKADHNTSTLSEFRSKKLWQSENGGDGSTGKKRGRRGEDIELAVPAGTVVMHNDKVLADLEKVGDEAIIAHGGRGGYGNAHFISSTRQAPRMSEIGEEGESKELTMELKMVADVGLVGLPNAGKSTLLSVISNAKPKIADYPFTTLEPNLGVVDIDQHSFLVADIPGLIQGASKGKGLGDEFLRHVERTKLLLHLIDATSEDLHSSYQTIQKELKNYKIDLSGRPQLVVLTKIESVPKEQIAEKIAAVSKAAGIPKKAVHSVSAVASYGVAQLLRATYHELNGILKNETAQDKSEPMPTITLDESAMWQVKALANKFVVEGKEIEGFAKRTNFDQYQSVQRLHNILERKGITRQLIKLGAVPSESKVEIAGKDIQF